MTLALRTRLTVLYTAVFGVVLLVFGVVSYRVLARQLDTDATANLAELTSGLHGYLRFNDGAPSVAFDPNDVDQSAFIDAATRYYQIYDATTGRLLAQSQALEPYGVRFTPSEVKAFREHPAAIDLRTDYGRIRLSNSVMPGPDGHLYLLQVGGSLDAMDAALARFLTPLLWSLPAGLVAAALAGWAMASLSLAPLARLATAARQIDVRNLQQRLPVRGAGDELDAVAASFNDTLSRLEKAVEEMRQFSTALAHELRTPLTALRGEIEMSLLGAQPDDEASRKLASQLEEIDKLKRLIEQILTLARAEAGDIPLARDHLDLSALCASLVEQLEPVASAKGVRVVWERDQPAVVEGDARWLERVVLNLLDNGIKFTAHGGTVRLRIARHGTDALLEVADSGVGIKPGVLPHVFNPFFRADPAGSVAPAGVGVGLSLVKWIVDRHGGQIEAASEPGKGATFTIRLPLIKQN
jgi:heavy metal sensor kinase